MKRPILIFTVIYIIVIAGAQYFNISICAPFNLEKIYSTVGNCQIKGVIVEEQKGTEEYNKYILKVEQLNSNGKNYKQLKNTKIILKLKPEKKSMKVGNEVLINCYIELPQGQRNYGGSDYKIYLKTLGIYAISKIMDDDYIILKNDGLSKIDMGIYKIKSAITKNILKLLSNDSEGLCLGILLGDVNYISDDTKINFENSGLLHMLAVSGSHVSYIIVGVEKCLKKVNKRFQKIILIVFLIFFMKITGLTSSVVRARNNGNNINAFMDAKKKN